MARKKKCECGCGEEIPLTTYGNIIRRFKHGHHNKGKHLNQEHKKKIGLANIGNKNGMWRGDNVKYGSLHDYMKYHLPKPDRCEECDEKLPYDIACITENYNRDFDNWKWLCRSCHMKHDYRIGIRSYAPKVRGYHGRFCKVL